MSEFTCSVAGCMPGMDDDRTFELGDYEGATARWCPGCGDHAVLTAVQRLLVAEQLKPEQTVFVSGLGCSSRRAKTWRGWIASARSGRRIRSGRAQRMAMRGSRR